jgi:hypothetical protein
MSLLLLLLLSYLINGILKCWCIIQDNVYLFVCFVCLFVFKNKCTIVNTKFSKPKSVHYLQENMKMNCAHTIISTGNNCLYSQKKVPSKIDVYTSYDILFVTLKCRVDWMCSHKVLNSIWHICWLNIYVLYRKCSLF